MKNNLIQAAVLGGCLCVAGPAYSAVAISSLTGESVLTGSNESVYNVAGYDITVGSSSIWVIALGYYDPGHDGVVDSAAKVGIYDPDLGLNGTLLVDVAAGSAASSFDGDYRFITLGSPIQLAANSTYRIVANTGSNTGTTAGTSHNEIPFGGTISFGTELSVNTSTWYINPENGNGPELLNANSSGPAIYLGNFQYSTSVPEPSVAVLGLLSLGGLLRRRR